MWKGVVIHRLESLTTTWLSGVNVKLLSGWSRDDRNNKKEFAQFPKSLTKVENPPKKGRKKVASVLHCGGFCCDLHSLVYYLTFPIM